MSEERIQRIEQRIEALERGAYNHKQRCKNHQRDMIEVKRQVAGVIQMMNARVRLPEEDREREGEGTAGTWSRRRFA
jgi:hypothetical protein